MSLHQLLGRIRLAIPFFKAGLRTPAELPARIHVPSARFSETPAAQLNTTHCLQSVIPPKSSPDPSRGVFSRLFTSFHRVSEGIWDQWRGSLETPLNPSQAQKLRIEQLLTRVRFVPPNYSSVSNSWGQSRSEEEGDQEGRNWKQDTFQNKSQSLNWRLGARILLSFAPFSMLASSLENDDQAFNSEGTSSPIDSIELAHLLNEAIGTGHLNANTLQGLGSLEGPEDFALQGRTQAPCFDDLTLVRPEYGLCDPRLIRERGKCIITRGIQVPLCNASPLLRMSSWRYHSPSGRSLVSIADHMLCSSTKPIDSLDIRAKEEALPEEQYVASEESSSSFRPVPLDSNTIQDEDATSITEDESKVEEAQSLHSMDKTSSIALVPMVQNETGLPEGVSVSEEEDAEDEADPAPRAAPASTSARATGSRTAATSETQANSQVSACLPPEVQASSTHIPMTHAHESTLGPYSRVLSFENLEHCEVLTVSIIPPLPQFKPEDYLDPPGKEKERQENELEPKKQHSWDRISYGTGASTGSVEEMNNLLANESEFDLEVIVRIPSVGVQSENDHSLPTELEIPFEVDPGRKNFLSRLDPDPDSDTDTDPDHFLKNEANANASDEEGEVEDEDELFESVSTHFFLSTPNKLITPVPIGQENFCNFGKPILQHCPPGCTGPPNSKSKIATAIDFQLKAKVSALSAIPEIQAIPLVEDTDLLSTSQLVNPRICIKKVGVEQLDRPPPPRLSSPKQENRSLLMTSDEVNITTQVPLSECTYQECEANVESKSNSESAPPKKFRPSTEAPSFVEIVPPAEWQTIGSQCQPEALAGSLLENQICSQCQVSVMQTQVASPLATLHTIPLRPTTLPLRTVAFPPIVEPQLTEQGATVLTREEIKLGPDLEAGAGASDNDLKSSFELLEHMGHRKDVLQIITLSPDDNEPSLNKPAAGEKQEETVIPSIPDSQLNTWRSDEFRSRMQCETSTNVDLSRSQINNWVNDQYEYTMNHLKIKEQKQKQKQLRQRARYARLVLSRSERSQMHYNAFHCCSWNSGFSSNSFEKTSKIGTPAQAASCQGKAAKPNGLALIDFSMSISPEVLCSRAPNFVCSLNALLNKVRGSCFADSPFSFSTPSSPSSSNSIQEREQPEGVHELPLDVSVGGERMAIFGIWLPTDQRMETFNAYALRVYAELKRLMQASSKEKQRRNQAELRIILQELKHILLQLLHALRLLYVRGFVPRTENGELVLDSLCLLWPRFRDKQNRHPPRVLLTQIERLFLPTSRAADTIGETIKMDTRDTPSLSSFFKWLFPFKAGQSHPDLEKMQSGYVDQITEQSARAYNSILYLVGYTFGEQLCMCALISQSCQSGEDREGELGDLEHDSREPCSEAAQHLDRRVSKLLQILLQIEPTHTSVENFFDQLPSV